MLVLAACNNGSGDTAADAAGAGEATENDEPNAAPDREGNAEEVFCERARELIEEGPDATPTPEGIDHYYGELIDLAPDQDLRDALATIFRMVREVAPLDRDDQATTARVLALMYDPVYIDAAQTTNAYLVETCGMESQLEGTVADRSLDDRDPGDDPAPDDPLDATAIRDAVNEAMPDRSIQSASTIHAGGGLIVSLSVDTAKVDALTVCEAAVRYVDGVTGHDLTAIKILEVDGVDNAERDDGMTISIAPSGSGVLVVERVPTRECARS